MSQLARPEPSRPRRVPSTHFRRLRYRLFSVVTAVALTGGGLAMVAPAASAAADDQVWSGATAPLSTPWTSQVSPTNALPDYPRPQLTRPTAAAPKWMSLNGLWQYEASDGIELAPVGAELSGRVLVPYPIESVLSGV